MTPAPRPLRIALVHSFYGGAVPGGENTVALDQAEALRRAGHEVHLVAARTDDLAASPLHPLRCAVTVAGGPGRTPLPALRELAPDVVHVHNLFPNFGRAWAARWTGPLVATLHNYRPLCASAVLYRDGAPCTRCPDGDRWAGLRNGCYRGSRLATLPLAWASRRGVAGDPLLRRADRLVVLSDLSRETFERAGVPAPRMALIPNFVPAPATATAPAVPAWVYVGRLSEEKGILELLRRWPAGVRLDVIGNGPLEEDCHAAAPASVRFLGALDRNALRALLPGYHGAVFPSRCYEGAVPLVYVEALAAGLPVLAFEGSSVPSAVRSEGTGAVTSWDAPLTDALHAADRIFPALREHCRAVYTRQYGERAWTERMVGLYRELTA
ncbi:glycosyltransferase family 4 protein [Streptomyces sp. NPDC048338]|uniref:glycosyltransferase family 4 protein n=1 Tax=Streptomyces sp. NPDC048338 TaxID=3365536 RepID=UPI003711A335